MKKLLLSFAAAAACAMCANAQAPLYATGDFEASNWAPDAPVQFTYADGVYTLTIENVNMAKISTAMGTWDEFNAGALCLEANANDVGTYPLVAGDANVVMPWAGNWTLTVAGDLSTITFATTTPKPEGFTVIYLRGTMNNWGNGEGDLDGWEFATTDGETYTLNGVSIPEDAMFKIADSNWSKVNFGSPVPLLIDEPTVLASNGSDITIDYEGTYVETLNFTFNLPTATLTISAAGENGIANIATDNAAVVYYNLQGVRVANPENGIFIMKQGNKVSKVYVK